MKHIIKVKTPPQLLQFIKGLGKNSKNFNELNSSTKQELKEYLLESQGFICAYCMKNISYDLMKVEHYISQAKIKETKNYHLLFDYGNLLGVCEGKEKNDLHCDTFRSIQNKEFKKINPLKKDIETILRFPRGGFIEIREDDIDSLYDIENGLNLNTPNLVKKRKAAMEGIDMFIEKARMKRKYYFN